MILLGTCYIIIEIYLNQHFNLDPFLMPYEDLIMTLKVLSLRWNVFFCFCLFFVFFFSFPKFIFKGLVSIDFEVGTSIPAPIQTTVSHTIAKKPMYFSINAATKVYFGGDRYLHGWVQQEFSGTSGMKLTLTARARQFSCFILLLGRIGGPDSFEPKHAIIIKNKDDLKIPLLLENIPTPKEFKDAIESLSPGFFSFFLFLYSVILHLCSLCFLLFFLFSFFYLTIKRTTKIL